MSNSLGVSRAFPLRPFDPGGLLTGVLTDGTVVAAERTRTETFGKLFLAMVVASAIYWAGHAYTHHWSSRLRKAPEWTLGEITNSFRYETSILVGAALPLLVLAVAWSAGASIETAVTLVLWAAALELIALEVVPGIRHRLRPRDLAIQSLLGISMGIGMLGVRFVLH